MRKVLTFYILLHDEQVLLGAKKASGNDSGWWNLTSTFGWRPQNVFQRNAITCFDKRELDELGFVVQNPQKRGIMQFFYPDKDVREVHVYTASFTSGEPKETKYLRPKWFKRSAIPYSRMKPDDEYWLPFLLSGRNFKASFHFDKKRNLSRHFLERVDAF